MNWAIFALAAWVCFGLEIGLRDALRLGPTPIAPSFIVPLLVYVAASAPAGVTRAACLILGLVTDLTFPIELRDGAPAATIIGPYALGYLLAGQLVLTMRAMVIRRNPLSIAFLSVLAAAVAHVVVVAMLTAHSVIGDPVVWSAARELAVRLGTALATSVTGLATALALSPLAGVMGLTTGQTRRFARRAS